MGKVELFWWLFGFSALFFVLLSIVAVFRPLDNSTLDDISICLPFISLYYIIFGIHILGIYEEQVGSAERKN